MQCNPNDSYLPDILHRRVLHKKLPYSICIVFIQKQYKMQMQSLWKSDPYTVHTYLGGKSFFESILRKESSTFCGSLNSSKEILRNHIRVANIASSKVYPTAIMPHIYKYKLLWPRSARGTKVSSVVLRNLRDFGPMLRRRRTASASIGRPFRLSRRVFLSPNNRVEEEL